MSFSSWSSQTRGWSPIALVLSVCVEPKVQSSLSVFWKCRRNMKQILSLKAKRCKCKIMHLNVRTLHNIFINYWKYLRSFATSLYCNVYVWTSLIWILLKTKWNDLLVFAYIIWIEYCHHEGEDPKRRTPSPSIPHSIVSILMLFLWFVIATSFWCFNFFVPLQLQELLQTTVLQMNGVGREEVNCIKTVPPPKNIVLGVCYY